MNGDLTTRSPLSPPPWLINMDFYHPFYLRCGHCKKLAPEFEKAAQRLKKHVPPIALGKVDATVEKDLGKEYGVSGYPTLKILRKGRRFDYNGPRDADGIVEYMKEQAKPAAKELKSAKEIQRFMSQDDVTIVGFFDETEGKKLFENFLDAAEAVREDFKVVGYTKSAEALEHFKVQPDTTLVFQPERFWSKFEAKFKKYNNVILKFFSNY